MPRSAIIGLILTASLFSLLLFLNFKLKNDYVAITDPTINLKNPKVIRCKNFLTQTDAQNFFLTHAGLTNLDKDSDGIVCESLPL